MGVQRSGNTQHLSYIQQLGRLLHLLSIDQGNIYLSTNQINFQHISRLEKEFEEKYQLFLEVEDNPESGEYQHLKDELFRIDAEIDSLLWK